MAFETSSSGYIQIQPTFLPGYPYENTYHNVGQLTTPYQGKKLGTSGDYGPPQKTRYYTANNPTYPYVLDANFRAEEYIPTQGCCFSRPGYAPCYEDKYPDKYVPEQYFAPHLRHPTGHATPDPNFGKNLYTDMVIPVDPYPPKREYYGGAQSYGGSNTVNYRNIIVAQTALRNDKTFYPFGNQRYY
jgi:hypothetical protein